MHNLGEIRAKLNFKLRTNKVIIIFVGIGECFIGSGKWAPLEVTVGWLKQSCDCKCAGERSKV